jgi:hypothetical protein
MRQHLSAVWQRHLQLENGTKVLKDSWMPLRARYRRIPLSANFFRGDPVRLPSWIRPTPESYLKKQKKAYPPPPGLDRTELLYYELKQRLPVDVVDLFNFGRLVSGEIGISFPDAYEVQISKGHHAIIIHSGVKQFFWQVNQALFTQANIWKSPNERIAGGNVTFPETVEHVAKIFRELMENYQISKPVEYPLTNDQSDLANDIASQAEVFIFAHEIGHILITNSEARVGAERPGDEEYEADRIALELVLGLRQKPLLIPNFRKVYSGAVFAIRVYNGLERLGYKFQGTHPPPSRRLRALRKHAVRLFGGRRAYFRQSTTSFAIDRLLEAVERDLAGFEIRERTEQILANIMAMIIECAKGHLDEGKAASILADELVETMDVDRPDVAKEAAELFCPVKNTDAASAISQKEAECYEKMISLLPHSWRDLFVAEWQKTCARAREVVRPQWGTPTDERRDPLA